MVKPINKDPLEIKGSIKEAPIRKDYLTNDPSKYRKVNKNGSDLSLRDTTLTSEEKQRKYGYRLDPITGQARFTSKTPGRPKGSHRSYGRQELLKAIRRVERKRKIKYLEQTVEDSLDKNNSSMASIRIAILKRTSSEMKAPTDTNKDQPLVVVIGTGNQAPTVDIHRGGKVDELGSKPSQDTDNPKERKEEAIEATPDTTEQTVEPSKPTHAIRRGQDPVPTKDTPEKIEPPKAEPKEPTTDNKV